MSEEVSEALKRIRKWKEAEVLWSRNEDPCSQWGYGETTVQFDPELGVRIRIVGGDCEGSSLHLSTHEFLLIANSIDARMRAFNSLDK
jgi:hypothetical protein